MSDTNPASTPPAEEQAPTTDQPVPSEFTFEWRGVLDGFVAGLPIAIAVASYGIAFGVLAQQAGLSVAEAVLMAATVIAGVSEIIAIELWEFPVPVAAIVATTFVINLRYTLMSAALRPWYRNVSPWKAYSSVLFIADENWAMTMRELQNGEQEGGFLLGSGLAIHVFWITTTAIGATAGKVIDDPGRYGFDFALTAVFITLLVSFWDGRSNVLPWVVTAVVAVASAQLLPGKWYILLGGLVGAVVEVARYDA